MPPNGIVQGVQVWGLGRPKVFWPKVHVHSHPLLHTPGGVCWGTILLKNVAPGLARFFHNLEDLGQHLVLQDGQIICRREPVARRDQIGGILSPVEATMPSIITDAGCLVLVTLRSSSLSLPKHTTRSFCLLMTGSTVKVFSSLKKMMRSRLCFRSFRILLQRSSRVSFCVWVRRGLSMSLRDFLPAAFTVLDTVDTSTFLFLASSIIFCPGLSLKAFLTASGVSLIGRPLQGLSSRFSAFSSHLLTIQTVWLLTLRSIMMSLFVWPAQTRVATSRRFASIVSVNHPRH